LIHKELKNNKSNFIGAKYLTGLLTSKSKYFSTNIIKMSLRKQARKDTRYFKNAFVHAQWRCEAKYRPGPTIEVPLFPNLLTTILKLRSCFVLI